MKFIFTKFNSPRRALIFALFAFGLFMGSGPIAYAEEQKTPEPGLEQQSEKVETFEGLFKIGVEAYQSKKFDLARDALTKALEKNPQNVSTLTNLALAQFQLGKKGAAVALLRKAQNLDPDFSTPKAALKFILPQLEIKEIPHELHFFENLRSQILVPVPLNAYLILSALLLFAAGWILIGYLGAKKRALKDEKPFPPFPTIGATLALAFMVCLTTTLLKIYDYQTPRGTILDDKVAVLAAPDEKAAVLFDLYSGLEVIIQSTNQDWVQVNYPGALTGWIRKSALLHTAGKSPW